MVLVAEASEIGDLELLEEMVYLARGFEESFQCQDGTLYSDVRNIPHKVYLCCGVVEF